MKHIPIFFFALLISAQSHAASDQPKIIWQSANSVDVKSCCEGTPKFVVTGGAASLLLKDVLSLQAANDPLSAAWAGAFDLRAADGASGRASVALRLGVDKTPNSEVTVVLIIAGKSFVNHFPYGAATSRTLSINQKRPLGKAGLPVLIQIFATRASGDDKVLVSLDSLDAGLAK
jgi:hypothetical protein